MQMTVRNRIKDLLPVLVVFFVVALVGAMLTIEYVLHEPLEVPAAQKTPADELPHPQPFVPRH